MDCDRGLVGNRSMLSDISHTSSKSSSILFDGSAEKETDLHKNAQCFFKSLSISQLHSIREKWIWVIIFNWQKRVEMPRSAFHTAPIDSEMGKLVVRIYNLLLLTVCDCENYRVVITLSRSLQLRISTPNSLQWEKRHFRKTGSFICVLKTLCYVSSK